MIEIIIVTSKNNNDTCKMNIKRVKRIIPDNVKTMSRVCLCVIGEI